MSARAEVTSMENVATLVADSNKVHYIVPFEPRIVCGSRTFCTKLEYMYFTPDGTPLNDQFQMHVIPLDDMLVFWLISIPKETHWAAVAIAASLGLELRHEQYPSTMGPEGFIHWKFPSKTSYYLSFKKDHPHLRNPTQDQLKADFALEDAYCDEIIKVHNAKYADLIAAGP